jgi:hypothetical protein
MLNSIGIENSEDMILFNFRKNWYKIKPFLFDEYVQSELNEAMYEYMQNEMENLDEEGIKYDIENFTWIPGTAPYLMTTSDYWCYKRKPKDYSVGWYQCIHACHWISRFALALGEKLYPELDWMILQSDRHSIACGFKNNISYMIFDILNFETMSVEQVMVFANDEMSDEEYYSIYGR